MLAIKNNIMASNAARHLGTAYDSLSQSVERLSSGLRINSAKDDAAGLAVRELVRADVSVLQQGSRNAQDGISMLQTMEGAMAVMDENLIRMKELAEQASTGSYSEDQRQIMNSEFAEMANEIERIANSTSFNDISMLNSSSGSVSIHIGTDETIDIDKVDMTKSGLGIETGSGQESRTTVDNHGVAAKTDNFLKLVEDGTDASTVQLGIKFDGEQAINVDYAVGSGATVNKTLEEVVDDINAVSQNLGNDADGNSLNYKAAEAVYDSDTGNYELKILSRDGGNSSVAINLTETSGTTDTVTADLGDVDSTGGGSTTQVTAATGGTSIAAAFDALDSGAACNILTASDAQTALDTVESAISTKDAARASFGYKMNRLESTTSILNIQAENLMSAESRISDVDVATEMAKMTRNQVLAQAGVSMLSQANSMPQMAMTLLR
jgi:flagellin